MRFANLKYRCYSPWKKINEFIDFQRKESHHCNKTWQGKKAISPVLWVSIGLNLCLYRLWYRYTWTFTGEHSRQNDVQRYWGKKCMAGLNATNYEIAIASEGSFLHPQIWIRQCNEERLMIIDKKEWYWNHSNYPQFWYQSCTKKPSPIGLIYCTSRRRQVFQNTPWFYAPEPQITRVR